MKEEYELQIDRVIRGLKRIPRDPFVQQVSEDLIDDYAHLLTDLYHLKDHLTNDVSSKIDSKELNKYIENDQYLKKLQSLSNIIKHLKVANGHNTYPNAELHLAEWKNHLDNGQAVVVVFDKDRQDPTISDTMLATAFVVACINSWNSFFQSKNMRKPFSLDQLNIDFANQQFYRDLLELMGWSIIFETQDTIGYKSKANGDIWLVDEADKPTQDYDFRGLNHLAIRTESQEDIDTLADFLKQKGILALFDTPAHREEFVESRSDTYYQVMFKSPDDILFEVVYIGAKTVT